MLRLVGRIKRQEDVPRGLTEQIVSTEHGSPPLPRTENFLSEPSNLAGVYNVAFWMRCQPISQFVELLLKQVQLGKRGCTGAGGGRRGHYEAIAPDRKSDLMDRARFFADRVRLGEC